MKSTSIDIAKHILFWFLVFLLLRSDEFIMLDTGFQSITLGITYLVSNIVVFYYFYLFIGPRYLNRKGILYIFLGIPLFVGVRAFLQEYVCPLLFGFDNYYDQVTILQYFWDNLFRSFIPALAGTLYYLYRSRQKMANELKELALAKQDAEMQMLRSQLNPHFLFNTMSFLHTQTLKYDEHLAHSILNFSDVLRYALKNTKQADNQLSEEVEIIENYIRVFRDRYEGRFFCEFTKSVEDGERLIEPFILLPFVENAIKHGVFTNSEYPIKIDISTINNQLIFTTKNLINFGNKDKVHGIGITNLKKRLAILYPHKHKLNISIKDNMYRLELNIEI